MPLPKQIADDMARRYADVATAADRDRRRDLLRAAIICLIWAAAGIACILWSAHTAREEWSQIAFYGGIAIGNGGVVFTILGAYRRGEERGDW
ncbi:MAG TPA: hypothetical protein VFS05_15760 [Gemmatimonadaceae bacterium]|nr:hypothetical protein [Gemmatimonadaceae bacterium]